MTPVQRTFYQAFLVALVLCWSPWNLLAYLAPPAFLAWLLIGSRGDRRLVVNSCLALAAWVAWICVAGLVHNGFSVQNSLVALLTHSALLACLVVPTTMLAGRDLLERVVGVLLVVVAVEGVIGIGQALYGFSVTRSFDIANGDYVEGTIHPWLPASRGFDNPMFAANMTLALLALVVYFIARGRRRGFIVLWLGAVALVLASVVHVLLFLAVALVFGAVLYPSGFMRRLFGRRARWVSATFLVVVPLAAAMAIWGNLRTLKGFYELSRLGDNPKLTATLRLLDPDRDPTALLLGYGPGQAVSRSALIGTGRYFGGYLTPRPLPVLEPVETEPIREYIMDLWVDAATRPYPAGSTLVPFSSWLAVFSEAGLLGTLVLLGALARVLWRARALAQTSASRVLALGFGTGTLLIFLLGAQEHYWEIPQAIFVGLLLLKLMYANLRTDLEGRLAAASTT